MITLYCLLLLLLIGALGLLAVPLLGQKKGSPVYFTVIAVLMTVFSFGWYTHFGLHPGLNAWLTQGKKHYQLQEQFLQLGGLDVVISRIQEKLKKDPNDAHGWVILGKLYLAKHDQGNALIAFRNAHRLQPNDAEITRYYHDAED